CKSSCRLAFHAAARSWALDAIHAGVLSIADLKKGTQPTCMLPETASAVAPTSTCSSAECMPAGGPSACASPAELVYQVFAGIAAGGAPIVAQTQEEVRGAEWEVKRDDTRSTPHSNGHTRQPSAALEREWGGKHEVRTYYGTADGGPPWQTSHQIP